MAAEDSVIWDMVAMTGKLPFGNHGVSSGNIYKEVSSATGISSCIPRHLSVDSFGTSAFSLAGVVTNCFQLPRCESACNNDPLTAIIGVQN